MQSQEICEKTGVSPAETAKVLQLLVLGGFVTSRRGSKGGFQLARKADQVTTGEVIDFFLAKHRIEPAGDCPVMCALEQTITPGQEAFARLTLAEIVAEPPKSAKNSSQLVGVK
jgi:DNA-binding IscR family transcriptional regulator